MYENGDLNPNPIILFAAIAFLLILIPFIFFLVSQQNTLKAIQFQNRSMPPGQVWLQLIPLFGLVWQFVVVIKISDSIRKELSSANLFSFEQTDSPFPQTNERPAYSIGIAYCVLSCCTFIPVFGSLAAIAGLICWIIYWVKLSEYKNRIQSMNYDINRSIQ